MINRRKSFEDILAEGFIKNALKHTKEYKKWIYIYADLFIERFNLNPLICSCCGTGLKDDILPELHHINGDNYDGRPENLQFLCPNCHSKTSDYKGKKQDTTIKHSNSYLSNPENVLMRKHVNEVLTIKNKKQNMKNKVNSPLIEIRPLFETTEFGCTYNGINYLNKKYTAESIGVSIGGLDRLVAIKQITPLKYNNKVYFSMDSLKTYMDPFFKS